jgi:hypothetical protein
MQIAVGLFERYALGNVSAKQLEEETGLAASGMSRTHEIEHAFWRARQVLDARMTYVFARRLNGRDDWTGSSSESA